MFRFLGPSGISDEKLEGIRDSFKKGEDLNTLARIADIPMNFPLPSGCSA